MKQLKLMFFTYSGRLPRKQYLLWLIYIHAFVICTFLTFWYGWQAAGRRDLFIASTIFSLPLIALTIPALISLCIRRLHDIDQPGWLCLAILFPYVGYLFPLVIGLIPGASGPNQYGNEYIEPGYTGVGYSKEEGPFGS